MKSERATGKLTSNASKWSLGWMEGRLDYVLLQCLLLNIILLLPCALPLFVCKNMQPAKLDAVVLMKHITARR